MGNKEEGLRWLEQAQADLKTGQDCERDENFYASAFFAQQAAEKALKGYLYSLGFRAVLTHSVFELLEAAAKQQKGLLSYSEQSKELDRHYIGSRYPNFYPAGPPYRYYNKEIAGRCLSYAELILNEVKKYMPG